MTNAADLKKQTVWINGILATMNPEIDDQYGILNNYALVTEGDKIAAIVPGAEIKTAEYGEVVDLKGALVTPGLIDCHTHLVFGGKRADEWEKRLNGVSYAEIAAAGGGINATVGATREASFDDLYEISAKRMQSMADNGVTTLEAKSGYGLNYETEKKMLSVIKKLKGQGNMDISPTLLAAHSVPPEYKGRPAEYVTLIIEKMLPEFWKDGLFEAVDVFAEHLAFDLEQTERLFKAATALNIPVKAHSEQMSNMGASGMVAKYKGLSTDHIEHLDEEAIKLMSQTRTVATLLPLAFYFLRDTNSPPIDLLRKYKVPMAVSTDFNPGTSPFTSIRQAMNAACTMFSLTPVEAFAGVTRNAAMALGRENSHGQLKTGFVANMAVWEVKRPVEIFYELSYIPLVQRVFNGKTTM